MNKFMNRLKRSLIGLVIIVQIAQYPAIALADDASPPPTDSSTTVAAPATDTTVTSTEPSADSSTTQQTTPTDTTTTTQPVVQPDPAPAPAPTQTTDSSAQPTTTPNQQGPTSTPGPQSPTGADSKTYTLNPSTGLWENAYYVWDPVTHQTSPKTPQTYSYNPATGRWDTTQYVYNPASNTYIPNVVSVTQPPQGALLSLPASNQNAINPLTVSNTNQTGVFDLFYNATISNNLTSTAHSGDAAVLQNTLAGNALSGNASAILNLFNMIQSSWNPLNGSLVTFLSNIEGNVVGDLHIDPGATNPGISVPNQPSSANLAVGINNNAQINNDILLSASSGNATVAGNTQAGNAGSGSAQAIADVVNLINTSIASGSSFLGMINIKGNLEGDILLPQDLLMNLLASNAPRTTIDTTNLTNSSLLGNFTNNQSINNNLNLNAASGVALVDHNTTGGNAATGSAATNVTIFNLTGKQIIGSDALLVFVNVMGEWVGVITNAPAGATSAMLGDASASNTDLTAAINSVNNNAINNNITVAAQTGDATVANNTQAGSASSGNASAGVNLVNVENSNLSLSKWFGILFINVFGSWHGSFGVDTPYGNPVFVPSFAVPAASGPTNSADNNGAVRVFRFVPTGNDQQFRLAPAGAGMANPTDPSNGPTMNTVAPVVEAAALTKPPKTDRQKQGFSLFPVFGLVFGISLLAGERVVSNRQR